MGKRTIIINGSPRPNGNTAYLIDVLRGHLEGEIIEISAFRSGIAPCVDCRGCWETAKCVVQAGCRSFTTMILTTSSSLPQCITALCLVRC